MKLSLVQQPLISVVVPLYNKEKYIEATISSILNQTFEDYEIVVINDGSTDNSLNVLKNINDERIKIIEQENGGDGSARNTGIRQSIGELIAFIDGDDEWEPDFLQEVLRMKSKYPNAGMFATGTKIKYPREYAIDVFIENNSKDYVTLVENYFELCSQRNFINSSNVAIPRYVFNDIGFFLEKIGVSCDRDMWARVAMKYDVVCSSKILAIYHCEHSSGRVTHTSRKVHGPPAIHNTVNTIISKNGISAVDQSVIDFVHLSWFGRIDRNMRDGNITEAKRILTHELSKAENLKLRYLWTKFLIYFFPLKLAQLILRLQRSRWFLAVHRINWNKSDKSFPRVVQKVSGRKTSHLRETTDLRESPSMRSF